jgi:cell division protein FtsN
MRTVVVVLFAAALGVSSAFLVACGDRNSLIPKGDASAMRSDLDNASALYAREECKASQRAVLDARSRAKSLPAAVDHDLTATLQQNLDIVLSRIKSQCGKQTTTQTTATTATTQTQTHTTQTQTTPTTTQTQPPTTTTTEPPPPTQPTPAPVPNPGGSGGTPPGGAGGNG